MFLPETRLAWEPGSKRKRVCIFSTGPWFRNAWRIPTIKLDSRWLAWWMLTFQSSQIDISNPPALPIVPSSNFHSEIIQMTGRKWGRGCDKRTLQPGKTEASKHTAVDFSGHWGTLGGCLNLTVTFSYELHYLIPTQDREVRTDGENVFSIQF